VSDSLVSIFLSVTLTRVTGKHLDQHSSPNHSSPTLSSQSSSLSLLLELLANIWINIQVPIMCPTLSSQFSSVSLLLESLASIWINIPVPIIRLRLSRLNLPQCHSYLNHWQTSGSTFQSQSFVSDSLVSIFLSVTLTRVTGKHLDQHPGPNHVSPTLSSQSSSVSLLLESLANIWINIPVPIIRLRLSRLNLPQCHSYSSHWQASGSTSRSQSCVSDSLVSIFLSVTLTRVTGKHLDQHPGPNHVSPTLSSQSSSLSLLLESLANIWINIPVPIIRLRLSRLNLPQCHSN
jgi:uncharacterized protein YlaN (UPF0358 family)